MYSEVKDGIVKECISFHVYRCPEKPTESGEYIGKTPVYEQAVGACERAKARGRLWFIKGELPDGTKHVFM